jgi:hypothetical protein
MLAGMAELGNAMADGRSAFGELDEDHRMFEP